MTNLGQIGNMHKLKHAFKNYKPHCYLKNAIKMPQQDLDVTHIKNITSTWETSSIETKHIN